MKEIKRIKKAQWYPTCIYENITIIKSFNEILIKIQITFSRNRKTLKKLVIVYKK